MSHTAEASTTAETKTSSVFKQPYIFQWTTGNYRLVGPFGSRNDATGWAKFYEASSHDDPRWELMWLTAGEIVRLPKPKTPQVAEFRGMYGQNVPSFYAPPPRMLQIPNSFGNYEGNMPQVVQPFAQLASDSITIYVLNWMDYTNKEVEFYPPIQIYGPFTTLTEATSYGKFLQNSQDDNPRWATLITFCGKVFSPIEVVAPTKIKDGVYAEVAPMATIAFPKPRESPFAAYYTSVHDLYNPSAPMANQTSGQTPERDLVREQELQKAVDAMRKNKKKE